MNRADAYNILTQLLSDLDDEGQSYWEQDALKEYQDAINFLDDKAREAEKVEVTNE